MIEFGAAVRGAALTLTAGLLLAACGDRGGEPDTEVAPPAAIEGGEVERQVSETLTAIRARGRLNCGVNEGLVGFAYTDNRGQWRGFDIDFCRALAAATLGDPNAVRFVPLNTQNRFDALRAGRIDVLWRNSSWTMTKDVEGRFAFAGVNYYDGQGFLVRRSLDLNSAAELNGARICVAATPSSNRGRAAMAASVSRRISNAWVRTSARACPRWIPLPPRLRTRLRAYRNRRSSASPRAASTNSSARRPASTSPPCAIAARCCARLCSTKARCSGESPGCGRGGASSSMPCPASACIHGEP